MSKLPYKRAEESNPFFCEEDDDDWGSNSGFKNRSRNQFDDGNDELEQLQVKIDASENRSLDSITRTRQVLAETEDIGNKTAEELLHQGEQLDNTEERLDSISKMTKVTQRNINSIKSVFGGIKNWFQQKNETSSAPTREVQHSRLREVVDDNRSSSSSMPTPSSSGSKLKLSHPHKASRLYNESDGDEESHEDNFRDVSRTSSKQAMIDDHLSEIGAGVSRLKELSLGMNDELKRQDDQLGRLMDKTAANSDVLHGQNKQMRGLLS